MTEFPVPLDNLIAYVRALHPDGGPLDNVADAFAVSARLDEQSDALIGYFVDQARKSGESWSQIGAAMGVSKQAAQKRFVPAKAAGLMTSMSQPFSQFTERAARVLGSAGRLAADQPIGAAHLMAALLSEPESLAAKAITAAGLAPEQVYAAVGAGPAPQGPDMDSAALLDLSLGESARAALKGALKSALRLGHNYIGTEHLLLGVVFAGGPAADALSALGLSPRRAEQLVAAEIAAFQARREH
jgi:hypothetical protein